VAKRGREEGGACKRGAKADGREREREDGGRSNPSPKKAGTAAAVAAEFEQAAAVLSTVSTVLKMQLACGETEQAATAYAESKRLVGKVQTKMAELQVYF
jgi:hypothetical protein